MSESYTPFYDVPEVPESSTELGNTISNSAASPPKKLKINPAKRWAFTLNHWTDEEFDYICSIVPVMCDFGIIAKETGDTGTPHLQGYIEFKTKARPLSVFKTKRIHWEVAKGNRSQNIVYCSKQNPVWDWGMPPKPKPVKIITELRPFQLDIEKIILEEPDDRTIHWYYDAVGNIGKSAFIKYCVVKHNVLFIAGGKYGDIMNIVFNTDMDKVNCVMLDIPRANEGNVSYASLESIKNGLICNYKFETGFKAFNSPHIIVFANFAPKHAYKLSADRWKITNLGPPTPIVYDDDNNSYTSFDSD